MKLYKTLIYAIIFVIVMFSVIFSYMLNTGSIKPEGPLRKKRILLLAQVYQNPYWQIIKKGAEDAALSRKCIVEYDGPQTTNIPDSLKLFDMGIAAKVDGIITSVQDDNQYIPYIDKAAENGIPVITVDTDSKKSKRLAYVGTNNYEAGRSAGEQLVDLNLNSVNIGIIIGGIKITSQIEKVQGFKSYIKPYKNMKVIAMQDSNDDVMEAEFAARRMILEYPDLNCLYCTSSLDGIGAARAVIGFNKQGSIKIICFDDLPETLSYIKDGVIQASIVQRPYQMGYDSVNLIMDKLEGIESDGEYLMGIISVTKDNVDKYNTEIGEIN